MTTDAGVVPEQDETPEAPGTPPQADATDASAAPSTPGRARRVARRVAGSALTLLAVVLVHVVLTVTHDVRTLNSSWYARIPAEGVAVAAVLLLLGARARRRTALVLGVVLGLLAVVAAFDTGFNLTLARPFDLVLDWSLLVNASDYLRATGGTAAVVGGWVGLVVVGALVLAVSVGAMFRLAGVLDRRRRIARPVVVGLAAAWVVAALAGVQVADGVPVAATEPSALVAARAGTVGQTLNDVDTYRRELATDRFADVPPDRLLSGLRGKDVLVTVVESYGRVALEDPAARAGVDPVLTDGQRTLTAAGFSARSGWLTSSTFGGGSWFAHSTFFSGTWVDTPQRYRWLLDSDRLTLPKAFERAGWQTAAVLPSVKGEWPEGDFYGYQQQLQFPAFTYLGPRFGWSPIPDQFVLDTMQRVTPLGQPGHRPVMAEIALTSSHSPWAPLPQMVAPDALGDGTGFWPIYRAARQRQEVWADTTGIRTEYGKAVGYSLSAVVDHLERHGTKDTVVVMFGDHQPLPLVSGNDATHDVPVTILAKDPTVLAALDGWGWTDGLRPAADAPVWPMSDFRDRFFAAYTPGSGS